MAASPQTRSEDFPYTGEPDDALKRAKGTGGAEVDVAGGEAGEEMMGQEEKMKVRQMLTLPGWFPGDQQPIVCAEPLQLRHSALWADCGICNTLE